MSTENNSMASEKWKKKNLNNQHSLCDKTGTVLKRNFTHMTLSLESKQVSVWLNVLVVQLAIWNLSLFLFSLHCTFQNLRSILRMSFFLVSFCLSLSSSKHIALFSIATIQMPTIHLCRPTLLHIQTCKTITMLKTMWLW